MSYEIVPYGKSKGRGGPPEPAQKVLRRTIDYGSPVVRFLQDWTGRNIAPHRLQCHYSYTKELLPPFATPQSPYDSICCRFVHSATTKNRAPVNVVHWFPNGRRLLSGSQTGEIIIWNGFQFHFENILQAHNAAVRAMEWTPEETVLVSGDQLGIVKFWDQYLYNFNSFQAHKESICDISIAPTGLKFVSCAEDSHAKVWDLRTGEEERAFTGHGWDVKCCTWHPTKGLVATGSKDSQIKLWDPRASEAITTIFCHKNTVTRVVWSPNGQWLASGSRDQLVMLMDIRTMSVRKVFKAHTKEVTALCWHPESDALLASGGYDSNLHFWDTNGSSSPLESVIGAHDGPIWCLAWNPLGHLLVSGSHDYSTRFWSRARPGDIDFQEILPKKVGAAAVEAAALGASIAPPTPPPRAVFNGGVFAGAPLPPPTPEELKEQEEAFARAAMGDLVGKALEDASAIVTRTTSGLSLGDGPGMSVLDAADFDEEEAAGALTKRAIFAAAPAAPTPVAATPLAPATPPASAPVAATAPGAATPAAAPAAGSPMAAPAATPPAAALTATPPAVAMPASVATPLTAEAAPPAAVPHPFPTLCAAQATLDGAPLEANQAATSTSSLGADVAAKARDEDVDLAEAAADDAAEVAPETPKAPDVADAAGAPIFEASEVAVVDGVAGDAGGAEALLDRMELPAASTSATTAPTATAGDVVMAVSVDDMLQSALASVMGALDDGEPTAKRARAE